MRRAEGSTRVAIGTAKDQNAERDVRLRFASGDSSKQDEGSKTAELARSKRRGQRGRLEVAAALVR